MRIVRLTAVLLLASCTLSRDADPVARQQSGIAYGTADGVHTAVVALLGDGGSGSFTECTGTVVQVKNGSAYVLTAAHCCNTIAPSIVVAANDYSMGEMYVTPDSGTPQPPAYPVTSGSIWYDAKYNVADHDFCMLKFPASGTQAVLALPSGSDGLTLNTPIETVGFGVTDSNSSNSLRRHGTSAIDQSITTDLLVASSGGSSHIPGGCEGDSGGPFLVAPGAQQSQQIVVGIVSFTNSQSCAQSTMVTAGRVTTELGTGGFITSYLADAPIGTNVGGLPNDGGAPEASTDASTPADASSSSDASASADASSSNEAGSENETTSGGGCTTSPGRSSPSALAWIVALALTSLRRRRGDRSCSSP